MDRKCLIQIYGGNEAQFIDKNGAYTEDINEAMIFTSELSAHEYIDERGIDHVTKVRRIMER